MVPVRQRASIILTLSHHPPHFTLNLLLHATLWGPRVTTPGPRKDGRRLTRRGVRGSGPVLPIMGPGTASVPRRPAPAAQRALLSQSKYRLGSPRAVLLCVRFVHSMFASARDPMQGMWIVGDGACHGTALQSSSSAHRLIKFH